MVPAGMSTTNSGSTLHDLRDSLRPILLLASGLARSLAGLQPVGKGQKRGGFRGLSEVRLRKERPNGRNPCT